jgi:filamentous hemagglutinin family protein
MPRKQRSRTPAIRFKPLALSIRCVLFGALLSGTESEARDLPVPQSVFATLGRADLSVQGPQMTVKQQTDRAILNWKSFDIGANNSVDFQQPGATSIALNRIAQNDPSQILGRLSANGQIYLINQNGFVFGPNSKVDVNSLTVSALNISDDAFQRGVTKVIDQDGRAALTGNGQIYLRDGKGDFILDADGKKQKIAVDFQPGAQVQAGTSGRILAVAPKVTNQGELSAPDGQILLVAAYDKVYLQEAGADSPVRGLLVEVGSGGEVTNLGKLLAERGNVTLLGFAVNQSGRATATTSVRAAGSVLLLAREGGATRREGDAWLLEPKKTVRLADLGDGLGTRATVTLGKNSLTEATPDAKDAETAVDGQAQAQSVAEIMGHDVNLEQDAAVISRSGKVDIIATANPDRPGQDNVRNDSRIHIAQGAKIDVSGLSVDLPMERNVIEVELRGNELRDSPLQKGGALDGATVKVDVRQGTPIGDILGALERIERTVAERSALGGVLNLTSEGDVVVRQNALLNFAGGMARYLSGYIATTQLIHDRQLVDIGQADPNTLYDGLTNRSGPNGLGRYETGYVDGKSAGQLNIKANALALDGELSGAAVNGAHQRDPSRQAQGGTLSIDLARTPGSAQTVTLQRDAGAPRNIGPDDPFPQDANAPGQPAALILSGERLRRAGIQDLSIATAGKAQIQAGERVELSPGGRLALTGGEIAVNGAIAAQAGAVELATKLSSANQDRVSGNIVLGAGGLVDVSGGWVNDRPPVSLSDNGAILIGGGSVNIVAQGDIKVGEGALIDIDGGGRRAGDDSVIPGDAGSIRLEAARVGGSNIQVQGEMRGYALPGGQGGALTLISDRVVIDDGEAPPGQGGRPLVLAPDFFRRGGFESYSIASNKSGLTVADGAEVELLVDNRVLDADYANQPSGADIATFSHIETLPLLSRHAGQLTLALAQRVGSLSGAALTVGKGAVLSVDAGGKITLSSDSDIVVKGVLSAPAGAIALNVAPPAGADPGFRDSQGIWLDASARIEAPGQAQVVRAGSGGPLSGQVLPGGSVSLNADRGFAVAQPGSVIDVSGASAELDLPVRSDFGGGPLQRQIVASDAGSVAVRAAEGIQLQGSLLGRAGAGAAGGALSLELNPRTRAEPDQPSPSQRPFPRAASAVSLAQGNGPANLPALDTNGPIPSRLFGQASLPVETVERGGFAALSLRTPDRIELQGGAALRVERSLILDAPGIAFKAADGATGGTVDLQSAYVAIGSSQTRPGAETASSGAGELRVQAGTLDLTGTAGLQGFARADLASSGDLRLVGIRTTQQQRDFQGEFIAQGDLALTADRVYPTTLSQYRIALQGQDNAVLSIQPGASANAVATPLSAGGKLTLEAPNIVQGGALQAPLGSLTLKGAKSLTLLDGSVTSISATGAIIPFGRTQGGLDWLYPLGGQNLVIAAPPAKRLTLNSANLALNRGAVVDISGGGDLQAFEFVPGPGGSVDRLDPTDTRFSDGSFAYRQSFAVIPGFQGPAPVDPLETPNAGLKVGDSVHLSAGGGLAAGDYVLLPAHYALLPGAFLVTPQPGTLDFVAADPVAATDGANTVAGYRFAAGTAIRDARWSGFAVASADTVRLHGEYQTHLADDFFAKADGAPALPKDAGAMIVSVGHALTLDGRVNAAPAENGRGGRLDLEAQKLAIVARGQAIQPGAVNLVAEDLNALGVSSVVLGALRTEGDGATSLDVKADTLELERDAKLSGPEIVLAARNSIHLAEGARVEATGATAGAGATRAYRINGDAAFLAVEAQGAAELQRAGTQNRASVIRVDAGSSLAATGGVVLDAGADVILHSALEVDGAALALGAGRIRVGNAASASGGLTLDSTLLQEIDQVDSLSLNSGSDIDLYGGVALNVHRLTLRTAGILGFENGGSTAILTADEIVLENPANAQTALKGEGNGRVAFVAKNFALGAGAYRLEGFAQAFFNLDGALNGVGAGTLAADADLTVQASALAGGAGADTRIEAAGHAVSILANANPAPQSRSLGARWTINADRVDLAGSVLAPAGVVALTALQGDIVLGQGASIDVSGRQVKFGDIGIPADGGAIELRAPQGNIALQAGAKLDLRGENGGALRIAAPQGAFAFAGAADAHGAAGGGDFSLETAEASDLGALGARLQTAGFDGDIAIVAHRGDLSLSAGEALSAHGIALNAAGGNLNIAGALTVAGPGAAIDLSAAGVLTLTDGARLAAQGDARRGGAISLDASNPAGGIELQEGARIALSADNGDANGSLALRAARTGGGEVAASGSLRDVVQGAGQETLEAVRAYVSGGVVSANDIAGYRADADRFMNQANAIESRLGLPAGALRPGVEVASAGDLKLGVERWDFLDWRYDGRPGVLTLKAGGDLILNGGLSDGFKAYEAQAIDLSGLLGAGRYMAVQDLLQPGSSWSFNLQAGRDVRVESGVAARTGAGDIRIDAGRDFVLADSTAAVYTAGHPADAQRYGTLKNAVVAFDFYGEYPTDGGDVTIRAGRDAVGARGGQFFDGWFAHAGDWRRNATHAGETPSAWAITLGTPDFNNAGPVASAPAFQQNLGALGGGDVSVQAGRNVTDLSIMIPTTGKQIGTPAKPGDPADADFLDNQVSVAGGGNLKVMAGGDIRGGVYYAGLGTGELSAAGAIAGGAGGVGPVLALGDSRFALHAGGDIALGAALNPTVVNASGAANFMFTYSAGSGIALRSLAGDVELQNDIPTLIDGLNALRPSGNRLNFPGAAESALSVYPASLNVVALQGDIQLDRSLVAYPSATGAFTLLAANDIRTGGTNVIVTQADADPNLLPSPAFPASNFEDASQRLQAFGAANLIHAQTPVHRGDPDIARIYAQNGGILPSAPLLFNLATAVDARAGTDMVDVSFKVQHPDYALSSISTGGSLRFTSPRNAQGNLINITGQIEAAGPGQLWLTAGGDIDLGAAQGVFSIGNTFNGALAPAGASIAILAGLGAQPQFDAFAQTYDPASPRYAQALTDYMRARSGDPGLDATGALAAYQALPQSQRREFLLQAFFDELRAAAVKAAKSGALKDYDGGFAAIQTLFPGSGQSDAPYHGDLKLFFSKIHTLAGGDINLLVPGGLVNAGLAVAFSGAKPASDLGIVAQREGAINAFVDGDFQVNQSRVFSLDGSDITVWSSHGDIDAGRGAKSAIAVPPPIVTFDAQGNLQVQFPPVVSGSGIRTAVSTPGRKPGDVYLAAPSGVVNAGEAGIGGNNVTIAATAVIGASNINVGGVGTGVPVANVAPPVTPGGAANAAAGAAQSAQQSTGGSEAENQARRDQIAQAARLTPLSVEVIGFGECSLSDIRAGKPGCGGEDKEEKPPG